MLIYTPFIAISNYLFPGNLFIERIFLKIPFILGNLICAYLIYRLILETNKEMAEKAKLSILYNPFLIFISAVWGMFDIWIVVFLLLSIYYLRKDNVKYAGLFFGLSVLIKPIPSFFGPIFVIYIWNKYGRNFSKVITFILVSIITFALICLPFFLLSPNGFLHQVFLMHYSRPPQAFSLILFFYQFGFDMTQIFSSILLLSIIILCIYFILKNEKKESEFLMFLLLTIIVFFIFNRIVNPQYFVIIISFCVFIIYCYNYYEIYNVNMIKILSYFLSIPMIFASLIHNENYIRMIPSDTYSLFNTQINENGIIPNEQIIVICILIIPFILIMIYIFANVLISSIKFISNKIVNSIRNH